MKIGKLSAVLTLIIIAVIIGAFVFQVLIAPKENYISTPNINLQPQNLNLSWNDRGVNEENLRNVALASGNFGLALFSQIFNVSNNTVISPLSIWLALAMLYEGARGNTAEEMRNVMYLPRNRTILEENIHWFLENFENHTENYTLSIANALWAQEGLDINKDYVQILQDYYNAYFQYLNFRNAEKARNIINSWVENYTNGKIKNLLPQGSITPETIAVLTNAIYFRAIWRYIFREWEISSGSFYTSKGKVTVDMMHMYQNLRYTEDKDAQILELPYRNCSLSMLIVLPKHGALNINIDKIIAWRQSLKYVDANLSLPKFELHANYKLKKPLERMGLKSVFTSSADLTGIFPYRGIYAEDVYHKTYISVNENGTEAAAATAIPQSSAASPFPMKRVDFNANHPFFFTIQDRETGAIFFMGWVANPIVE
ncbi:serpin family protein [Candidatus Aciduliprofundum boonei]|uniref:Proteinase inhibitor I4 serpin n=1 Tax=Aciduliprofundum boonei (strain DSM 19572 / T469) TaxID=439481 RepID=B5ICM5_ACIB4|nr:serpin family protein [Candidatus Aciduliprofundum boonei]ADD09104.1 proteinase inhibitor I4 serpin [Aciduliprofundum boonei T469]EDY36066.1 serine proteinase inhibitor [Aciduliprofundum boonei T469]HII55356.1 serpin family protein [Candidatus Aciduliprofundum boonei]